MEGQEGRIKVLKECLSEIILLSVSCTSEGDTTLLRYHNKPVLSYLLVAGEKIFSERCYLGWRRKIGRTPQQHFRFLFDNSTDQIQTSGADASKFQNSEGILDLTKLGVCVGHRDKYGNLEENVNEETQPMQNKG